MKKCACSGCAEEINHENIHPGHHGHECAEPIHKDSHDGGCSCAHDGGEDLTSLRQDSLSVILAAIALIAGLVLQHPAINTALMAAAILIAGLPIFQKGIRNILALNLEELALLTVAVVAAVCIGELFEAALVTLLFRIGEILEELAVSRSRREVEAVTKIIPDNASLILPDGSAGSVPARTLAVGSVILIKPGERLPVDCIVLSGNSSADLSSLTGESLPRDVGPGDTLLSGSINLGGALTCETISTFEDSAASKIIEMVRQSAAKKSSAEKLISRFARVYTPAVMSAALAVALLPPLLGFGGFPVWIYRALVFLVASCPCALVIATPLAFFAGIGACSRHGILIKGSRYIEALAKTKTVVFDKTGTLTTGALKVTDIIPAQGYGRDEVLLLAAICESASTHPIARAVVAELDASPDLGGVSRCEELAARGMSAAIDGRNILCGSARLMADKGVDISALPVAPIYLARDGVALGAIMVSDHLREDAARTIEELKALGVTRTAMLTGDTSAPALETQRLTGVDEVHHSLLPADKAELFERIKSETHGSCIFVGDGINDSPVLAQSDVGVAMGLASDSAMQAADVALLSDKLSSLPQAIRIARSTSRLARGIIIFALSAKMAVLAAAFLGYANMWLAVFADVGVSVISVIAATSALRLK